MRLLNRKPKTSIDDFCRHLYDSQIFCRTGEYDSVFYRAGKEGRDSVSWEETVNRVAGSNPSSAGIDRDLFLQELTALRIEFCGLSWMLLEAESCHCSGKWNEASSTNRGRKNYPESEIVAHARGHTDAAVRHGAVCGIVAPAAAANHAG